MSIVRAPGVLSGGPHGRLRAVAAPIATGVLGLSAATMLHLVDPNQPGHYPTCPFLALTGLYCPGCGSLRAMHDLTTLDLAGAWSMNPLTVLAVPYLLAAWVLWLRRELTGQPRRWIAPAWVPPVVGVLTVGFWVLRNLPGFGFLGPA